MVSVTYLTLLLTGCRLVSLAPTDTSPAMVRPGLPELTIELAKYGDMGLVQQQDEIGVQYQHDDAHTHEKTETTQEGPGLVYKPGYRDTHGDPVLQDSGGRGEYEDMLHNMESEHTQQHQQGFTHAHTHPHSDGHRHRGEMHEHETGVHHQHGEVHRHEEHTHTHRDGSIHSHQLPIYDSIRHRQAELLTQIERLYSEFQSQTSQTLDHDFPLVSMVESKPHSMTIMVSPQDFRPDTKVRLRYERVPIHRQPFAQQMDYPVERFYPLIRVAQTYTITDLPEGKYIVCGETMPDQDQDQREILQASCFETQIEGMDCTQCLQSGVKALIVISICIVVLVILYALLYQICKTTFAANKNQKPLENS